MISGADIFDGFFGIMFLYFCVKGLLRGLTGELCSLVGFFGGIFLAWKLGPVVAEHIEGSFSQEKISAITMACMAGIFVLINVFSSLIYKAVRFVVKFACLGALDRLGGILSGFAKGTALLLLVFVLGTMVRFPLNQSWFAESRSMRIASILWPYISEYVDVHTIIPSAREASQRPIPFGPSPEPEKREQSYPFTIQPPQGEEQP